MVVDKLLQGVPLCWRGDRSWYLFLLLFSLCQGVVSAQQGVGVCVCVGYYVVGF